MRGNWSSVIAVLIIFISTILMSSCSTNIKSLAMIGRGYREIETALPNSVYMDEEEAAEEDFISDTLIFVSKINNMPFEAIFLFEDDKCYYEALNIYCSECADELVSDIIKDKNYNFTAIDEVNYISSKDPRIVLRLKQKLNDKGNCNEISIVRVNNQ